MSEYGSIDTDGSLPSSLLEKRKTSTEMKEDSEFTNMKFLSRGFAAVLLVVLAFVSATFVDLEPSELSKIRSSGSDATIKVPSILSLPLEETGFDEDDNERMVGKGAILIPIYPPREETGLNETEYEKMVEAASALFQVEQKWNKMGSADNVDPKTVLDTYSKYISLLGAFHPAFSLWGGVLSIYASTFPNAMLVEMTNQFNFLNAKIDALFGAIDRVSVEICAAGLDDKIERSIYPIANLLYQASNPNDPVSTRKTAVDNLKTRCQMFRPDQVLYDFWSIIVNNDEKFNGCFRTIMNDDVKNRLGYFRTSWVAKFLKVMVKAVEYQAICNGLNKQESDNRKIDNKAMMPDCPGKESHECYLTKIYEVFLKEEKRMRNLNPGDWSYAFPTYVDKVEAYNILHNQYFPDWRYAVIELSDELKSYDDGNFGFGNKNYGILLKNQRITSKGTLPPNLLILYRNSAYKGYLPYLEGHWRNLRCPRYDVCTKKQQDCDIFGFCSWSCYKKSIEEAGNNCGSVWHQINEFLPYSNPQAVKLFRQRGVFMMRHRYVYYRSTSWYNRDFGDCYGDNICDVWKKREEDDPDESYYEFAFFDVAGSFDEHDCLYYKNCGLPK